MRNLVKNSLFLLLMSICLISCRETENETDDLVDESIEAGADVKVKDGGDKIKIETDEKEIKIKNDDGDIKKKVELKDND
ncbi:MAG TPA: hypothetical protein VFM70_12510 [Salinimicrobium sp.]|nr:hypothetical protein [Salinimicrobium sp.]